MSLSHCCRLFGISRQAIYQSQDRIAKRELELIEIKKMVLQIRVELPRLGTRKLFYMLKNDLQAKGIKIGRDALFDYLRRENLLIKPRKKYTKTTFSNHWLRKHPNLFNKAVINRPEQVFVSDITYIKSREKTHYLALVTDAYSRKIMGHHLSDDMSSESVSKALNKAINNRKNQKDLIHHSDRGIQYCASFYQKMLKENNIKPSMTDGYDCYQNALAERVNGILKDEFLFIRCKNGEDLKKLIDESVQIYNNRRPHLSLNMKTPNFVHEKSPTGTCWGDN